MRARLSTLRRGDPLPVPDVRAGRKKTCLLRSAPRRGYSLRIYTGMLIAAVFAFSLSFILNIGGTVSFSHAACFGLGAYVTTLSVNYLPMEAAIVGAILITLASGFIFGWSGCIGDPFAGLAALSCAIRSPF